MKNCFYFRESKGVFFDEYTRTGIFRNGLNLFCLLFGQVIFYSTHLPWHVVYCRRVYQRIILYSQYTLTSNGWDEKSRLPIFDGIIFRYTWQSCNDESTETSELIKIIAITRRTFWQIIGSKNSCRRRRYYNGNR